MRQPTGRRPGQHSAQQGRCGCRFRDVVMCCSALVWAMPEKADDVYERFRGCRRPGTNRLIGGGWPLQVRCQSGSPARCRSLCPHACAGMLPGCCTARSSAHPQSTGLLCDSAAC